MAKITKKDLPEDLLDELDEAIQNARAQIRSNIEKACQEHWIWKVVFAIMFTGILYFGIKYLLRFCEWINYNHPI